MQRRNHIVVVHQGNSNGGKTLQYNAPGLAIVAQRLAPVAQRNRHRPGCTYQNHTSLRHARQAFDNQGHHWQNLALAFLSVSQTTVDDEKSPNEFIYLAVATQFSGFRSVISSKRSFDDNVARQVVSAFTAT